MPRMLGWLLSLLCGCVLLSHFNLTALDLGAVEPHHAIQEVLLDSRAAQQRSDALPLPPSFLLASSLPTLTPILPASAREPLEQARVGAHARIALTDCAAIARQHHVSPGQSWGTLATASGQAQWRALDCDAKVSPAARKLNLEGQLPGEHGDRSVHPVFYHGLGSYPQFRIPVLARAGHALLAFAEARPTIHDHGRIDLVMRRSLNGGRTWSELQVIVRSPTGAHDAQSNGNPVPIYLPYASGGVLLLLFCSNAASITEDAIRAGVGGAGRRVWLLRSYDIDGQALPSWTEPVELTAQVKWPEWTWYATGPGGAILLKNGTIAVPATHASGAGVLGSGLDHSHLLLSHDGGVVWHLGGRGDTHTNEATVAQLADGSLLLNARDLSPRRRRVLHRSTDGGRRWSSAWHPEELTEPPPRGCHGAMVACTCACACGATNGTVLFYTGLASTLGRAQLAVWRSDDSGQTWRRLRLLHDGPAAYSSLVLLCNRATHSGSTGDSAAGGAGCGAQDDGMLGVLYERGESTAAFFAQRIVFEALPLRLLHR